MESFELDQVDDVRRSAGRLYQEFLRVRDLSAGLYVLEAGGEDPQQPHDEDELYHVVDGRATIAVGSDERPVGPGSLVFVAAGVPHRFHTITERLRVIVVFGPAESLASVGPEDDPG